MAQKRNLTPFPFWLSASNYFAIVFAVGVAVFFVVWAIFHEDRAELPLVLAGVCFSIVVVSAVIIRGKLIRRYQLRLLISQEKFGPKLKKAADGKDKLTIEKNNLIIKDIERKSQAANILGKLSEAHWEVFELCNSYLSIAGAEIKNTQSGSPRIPAIRKSYAKIRKLHRHHLLSWAANESKSLTQEAQVRDSFEEKIESGHKAVLVLETALKYYPDEAELRDSAAAVKEFILSTKVSKWIEEAEKFAYNGEYTQAMALYKDILFNLARENDKSEEKEIIAQRINAEIERLRELNATLSN